MKYWTPPTNEMVEKALSSVKKETDREYFFSKLNNPLWIGPLHERKYFSSPPGVKPLPNGYVQFPAWPELIYLTKVAKEDPKATVDIVLAIPKSDNPRVYDEILSIALQLEAEASAKLLPKLVEYTDLEIQFLAHRYTDLLQYWGNQGNIGPALEIAKRIIYFQADPKANEKKRRRRKDLNAFGTSLEPAPRFREYDYEQILEKGVHLLAEKAPYEMACILIDATADMIRLDIHADDIDETRSEDFSEIWCPKLYESDRDYHDAKQNLIFSLTHACSQVYEKVPELIGPLDLALRNPQWLLFHRLRQYLYATFPNDQNLPWIREIILGYKHYSKSEYHYELQLMIRNACEYFGHNLLREDEISNILLEIQSGPPEEDFREWAGDSYNDEAFKNRKTYFHLRQLRPFSTLLSGDIQIYFNTLNAAEQKEAITDDSYSRFQYGSGGVVNYVSPRSSDDIAKISDVELLTYLNEWEDEHRNNQNWLEEVNISALATVFQSFFKEKIIPDTGRLDFWINNRDAVSRPIYISSIVKAMQQNVSSRDFSKIDIWVEFCTWVMSHAEQKYSAENAPAGDKSRANQDWRSSRRAVVDFIDACMQEETNAPLSIRDGIANLLQLACNQSDLRLDSNQPVFLNRNDPYSEAINNTRSRAIESLIKFGFWIRRHLPDDNVHEVTNILALRITEAPDVPLTMPEYALLGVQFSNLFVLSRDWATNHRERFFPQQNKQAWLAAFGGYILYSRAYLSIFECLRGDFEFSLENTGALIESKEDGRKLIDRLGQHLFLFYLWKAYPLIGEGSLLYRFYEATAGNREIWANLFSYVGNLLKNSNKNIESHLIDRAIDFFDWRLSCNEAVELQGFSSWLGAECLDPEWRLHTFLKLVDLGRAAEITTTIDVRSLNALLDDHLPLVVECFARLTDDLNQNIQMYIFTDEASTIIRAGLRYEDANVRKNAERSRENLLKLGRFDFLDVE